MGLQHARQQTVFTNLGLGVLNVVALINLMFFDGVSATLLTTLAGLATIIAAKQFTPTNRSTPMALFGMATILLGALPLMVDWVFLIDFTSWTTLSILGASVIVAGSLIERFGSAKQE